MQQTITIIVAVAVFLVDATQYNARETGVVGLAAEGKLDVATTLLEHNADPNQARAADGTTPLRMAAENGHVEVVTTLLRHTADANQARTEDGSTPLSSFKGIQTHAELEKAVGHDHGPSMMETVNRNAVCRQAWALGANVNPIGSDPPASASCDEQRLTALEKQELFSLSSVSFVPTEDQITQLIAKSKEAETSRSEGARGPFVSKLYSLPGKFGLCPDSLDPNDTILCKLGRGSHLGGIGPGGSIGDPAVMTIIQDRNMPLGGGSAGPNGVLTACQGKYGPHRMNLFSQDKESTKTLLDDYLALRNANKNALFNMYVTKLNSFRESLKIDPTKDAQLEMGLQNDYKNVCDMFTRLAETLGTSENLSSIGIGVNSFCQTWLRNGNPVGNAQFSVMSPHFQTRHYVKSEAKVREALGNLAADYIRSYRRIIAHFDESTEKDYGRGGGGEAFINMDGLQSALSQQHHMFLVVGAPTAETVKRFKERHSQHGDQLRLVICASLEGYMRKRTATGTQNVYDLPTNFRAHFSDYTKQILQGAHVIRDDETFLKAQSEVSNALRDLFAVASKGQVPTYFAIMDRKDRPTCITVQGADVVATNINQRDLSTLPNVDPELTHDVLEWIVKPSFQNDKAKLVSELKRLTGGYRKDDASWAGSFLADVLSVACASCLDDADTWTRYRLSTNEVLDTGHFSKSETLSNVPFWSAEFDPSDDGNIYSFKASSLDKMLSVLKAFANDPPAPIWKSCFVWHDALLNDIDDLPAIELCTKLTEGKRVDAQCNWDSV